jgi:hypothetical protein
MMEVKKPLCLLAAVLLTFATIAQAQDQAFRFLATGDLPYTPEQDVLYRRLLKQSESEDFQFLIHVGDIKAQSVPCSDEEFGKIRDLFQAYPKPVVYTPGDNDWTDCRGVGCDPVERLSKLREMFFQDSKTLRLDQLKTRHQDDSQYSKHIENYRFSKSSILFIVLHVVGTGNNYRPDDQLAMQEYSIRNAANIAFLKESLAEAIASKALGVAVVIHANPWFEKGHTEGFQDLLKTLRGFLSEYRQPVICIHGDSHYYRVDKPLKDSSGKIFMHFTRMEVFGSPNVAGVSVTVDPKDSEVFSFRPYYLRN